MIHPTAIVHPDARIGDACEIRAYAVIDAAVRIGPECVVGPHVHLTGDTVIERGNRFHAGCVIGDAPQDLRYRNEPTRLRIGEGNTFREHVTINRSNSPDEDTVVGANNFFMAGAHVGHNCVIGDHNVFANNTMLGGHVNVGARVFIGGGAGAHQFVRIGDGAMLQGNAGASQDVPPFTVIHDINLLCGLNVVGLRRNGVPHEDRLELKRLYKRLFTGKQPLREAIEAARAEFRSPAAVQLLDFCAASKRGVCMHRPRRET